VSELTFRVKSELPELPIEVYDSGLTLLNRVLSSERMTVDAGHYYVIARLPGGDRLEATVDVPAGRPVVADLGDHRSHNYVGLAPRKVPKAMLEAGLEDRETKFGWKDRIGEIRPKGGVTERLSDELEPTPGFMVLNTGDTREGKWVLYAKPIAWQLPSAAHPHFVEPSLELRLRAPGGPPSCSVVPRKARQYLRPEVRIFEDRPVLVTRLKHETADALLRYLAAGQIDDAAVLTHSAALNAERLLEKKRGDPIAAAAGAFVLLALGDIDRLHDWTTNLSNWFQWLPDAGVALAEHQACLGDHRNAASTLEGLSDRGLPCLTIALALAISRMRTYVRADLCGRRMVEALEDLTRYAIACDLTATVTTFSAQNVWKPLPRGASTHDTKLRTPRLPKRSRRRKEST
jgi:hypothetical protein